MTKWTNVGPVYFQYLSPTASANCRKGKWYFLKLSGTVRVWQLCFWMNSALSECGHEQDTLHLDKAWEFTFSHLRNACGKRRACIYKPFVVSLLCIGLKVPERSNPTARCLQENQRACGRNGGHQWSCAWSVGFCPSLLPASELKLTCDLSFMWRNFQSVISSCAGRYSSGLDEEHF